MDGVYDEVISDRQNKRNAYTAMCLVGILMLVMSVGTTVFSIAVSYFDNYLLRDVQHFFVKLLSDSFGISTSQAVLAVKQLFSSKGFESILSMLGTLLFMFLPALVYSKMCGRSFGECFPVSGKKVKNIVAVFGAMELFLIASSAFSNVFYSFCFPDASGLGSASSSPSDGFSAFVELVHICFFVPFVEEFIFRGAVFRSLTKYGTAFAVVASAACFGLMHTSPVQSVYAFTFGLFSASLVVVTGNIKTSVLFHAINNLVTFGQDFIPQTFGQNTYTVCIALYYLLVITFGIYGLYKFFCEDGIFEKFKSTCKSYDVHRESSPGIRQILCFTVVIYILFYVYTYIYPIVMP